MRLTRSVFLPALALLLLLLPSVALLTGCGGGGDSNPIAGRYQGTFTTAGAPQGGNQRGTITATVDNDGRINGTANNTTTGTTATLTGTIGEEGQFQGTYTYPGGVVVNVSGIVGFTEAANMVGTLQATVQGSPFGTITIDLAWQPL